MTIKHKFQSTKGDGTDATEVTPSAWNNDHDFLTAATQGMVLGREPGSAGVVEELPLSITPTGRMSVFGTDGFTVPDGTTSQRPSGPNNGEMRYNTDTGTVEVYQGGKWGALLLGSSVTKALNTTPFDFTQIPSWVNTLQIDFNVVLGSSDALWLQFYDALGVRDTGLNYFTSYIVGYGNNNAPTGGGSGMANAIGLGGYYVAPVAGSLVIAGLKSAWRKFAIGSVAGVSTDGTSNLLIPIAGEWLTTGALTGYRLAPQTPSTNIQGTVTTRMLP